MSGSVFLGIDVGGTKIAGGIVSMTDGTVSHRTQILTAPARGGEAVLKDVENLAAMLANEAAAMLTPIDGVGIGLCELVSPSGAILSANAVDWQTLPVAERVGCVGPTCLEADVRAAALAEACFGAGRSLGSFLYITIGTGISSCLVIEGKPFTGARGATGTFASQPRVAGGESLEEIAAGPGLARRFNSLVQDSKVSSREVLAMASIKHPVATAVVESAGALLGESIGLLVNTLDPEAVIVGGGLGLTEGPYWEALMASARRQIWWEGHRDVPFLRAETGPNAGLIGAACAAARHFTPR